MSSAPQQLQEDAPSPTAPPSDRAPQVRPLRISILVKMILLSALLLIGVIAVFGAINDRQARRDIDTYSERLQRTISESLRQAGHAQLNLLSAAARIALLQSDYGSLKNIVEDVKRQDARITKAAILDRDGQLVAEVGESFKDTDLLRKLRVLQKNTTFDEVTIGAQHSIAFAMPVRYREQLICTALIAYSLEPLRAELAKAEETKEDVAAANRRNTLIVGLLAGLIGIILAVFQGLRMAQPIRALARQATRIAGGDFGANVKIASRDEIGQLGDTFNHMSQRIQSLMDDAQQQAALKREFEIANSIQTSLVPGTEPFSVKGMDLLSFFQPASECGGDWWSFYELSPTKTLVIIGDVTGHGVPAAMITALVKGAASTMVSVSSAETFDLQRLLAHLNEVVCESGGEQFYMTCLAALYDADTRMLTYANAGHNFPYVHVAGSKQMTTLAARGSWLGYKRSAPFEVQSMQMAVGDTIAWYTDGIVELEDHDELALGEPRFRRLLRKHMDSPLGGLRDTVIENVYAFAKGRPQQDDITMVLGRITG